MSQIPRDKGLDSTLALLSEGYTFVSSRCRRYGTDIFETRLMLRKAICTLGEEAARMFYHPDRFTRVGALPLTALLLQDKGSVQLLDGEAHRHRKQMFMSLMDSVGIATLADAVGEEWRAQIARWATMNEIVLHEEVRGILCRAVCRWAGVPLAESVTEQRTREFGAMIDGAGAVGPKNWRAQLLRRRAERWAKEIIAQVRGHKLTARKGSALHVIAWHRDADGELLEPEVATVELLNVLRPTVAVARFVVFAALALHEHPECLQRLRTDDEDYHERFAQEVRRYYPFFPVVGGRVRQEFEWRGRRFPVGAWVLLDLYGTNHDARIWPEPNTFQPDRFRGWNGNLFTLIPQGGGDYHTGHRCPGEPPTVELMKTAVRLLTREMEYEVPDQNLHIDLSKMPAIPQSGFIIRRVRGV